ncbi:ESPR-type extended signal peptide-containing protein [Variovorax sp. PAMC 28711]|uniref:ESPR-type extended signal peptide-containing protein n=1 Tax=Variovorax sp. PAMC 28711 TaxID=1795631 RepID=UPI00078BB198|nr:ESPR-type extended signal peptide-containing protein [Variovorax sp. PAMC 28711]AMM24554.1 hypothetical protein AX767_09485 [Variovorax sp. PAMC 28711]
MNKSYRSIWNEALGAWVAASEAVKSQGKRSGSIALIATTLAMGSSLAMAGDVVQTTGGTLGATATGTSAIALGNNAQAAGTSMTAIGGSAGTGTTGQDIVVIGNGAGQNMNGAYITVIGNGAGTKMQGQYNSVLGYLSGQDVTGDSNTLLGGYAAGNGTKGSLNTSLGSFSGQGVVGDRNTNVGTRAGQNWAGAAGGNDNTAVGYRAGQNASSSGNTALGDAAGNYVTGGGKAYQLTTAEGWTMNGVFNNAFGAGAGQFVSGADNSAMGTNAGVGVTGSGNVAVGKNAGSATITPGGTVVCVPLVDGCNQAGTKVGTLAINDTVAFGTNALANSDKAVAIGANSSATGVGNIALGSNSIANGATLGTAAFVPTGSLITAIKAPTATSEISIGTAGAERRITNVAAGGADTDGVNVSQLKALDDRTVKYDGSLGDPKNTVTLAGATSADGGLTGGTKITNLSQGAVNATSTDAINGAQLFQITGPVDNTYITNNGKGVRYVRTNDTGLALDDAHAQAVGSSALGYNATASAANAVAIGRGATASIADSVALGSNATTTAAVNTASATIGGTPYNFAGGTSVGVVSVGALGSTRQIQNVSAGQLSMTSTDAVNGSQLNATNLAVNNLFNGGTKYFHANSVLADSQAIGAESVAAGPRAVASGKNSVAIGSNANVTGDNSIALGNDSVATGATIAKTGWQPLSATGVALPIVGTTAIGEVSVGSAGKERRITNLAAGADDTDAVNLSQLKAVDGKIVNISNGAAGMFQVSQDYNSPPPLPTGTKSVAGGANAKASGNSAMALGNDSTASSTGSTAVGNGATSSGAGSVALGQGANDGGRGAESYTGKYSNAVNNTVGTVSVGNAATGETRTISNVADGKLATDAVNLRQLDGAVKEANTYTDGRITEIAGDITNINNGAKGMFQVSQDTNTPPPSPTGLNSAAGGAGSVASGNNSTAVGNSSTASGVNSTALGNGASATAANSVALGMGSVADRANSVSVGSVGNERQITNVKAGVADTDGVNVSQLKGTVKYDTNVDGSTNYNGVTLGNNTGPVSVHNVAPGVAGTDAVNVNQLNAGVASANAYTNQQVAAVQGQIDGVAKKAYAGAAAAMAMESAPYVAGKLTYSAGLGYYQQQTAAAVTLRRTADNGRWSITGGVSVSSGGVGARVGISGVFN